MHSKEDIVDLIVVETKVVDADGTFFNWNKNLFKFES